MSQPERIVEEVDEEDNFQQQHAHNGLSESADSGGINIAMNSSPDIFKSMMDETDEPDIETSRLRPHPDPGNDMQILIDEATRSIDDLADALEALDPDSSTFSITFRALRDQRRLRKSERAALMAQLGHSSNVVNSRALTTTAAAFSVPTKSIPSPAPRNSTPQKPVPRHVAPQPATKAPAVWDRPPRMPSPPPCPFNPDRFDEDDFVDIPSNEFDFPMDDSPARPAKAPAQPQAQIQSNSMFTTASKVMSTKQSDFSTFSNTKSSAPSHVIDMTGDDDDIDDDDMPAYAKPANKQVFAPAAPQATPNRAALSTHPEFSSRDGYPHSKELMKGLKSVC